MEKIQQEAVKKCYFMKYYILVQKGGFLYVKVCLWIFFTG